MSQLKKLFEPGMIGKVLGESSDKVLHEFEHIMVEDGIVVSN